MKLKTIKTGSAGNCYVLRSQDGESLIIEAGVNANLVKEHLDFDLSGVAGCIISHRHNDHASGVNTFLAAGVNVYATMNTHNELDTLSSHRAKCFTQVGESFIAQEIGGFTVMPFSVKHDVPCVGFLISHPESGKILFLTDSYYCPYTFKGLNNIIIEANYSKQIIASKYGEGSEMFFLRNRIVSSHMSLETCCELLKANDLTLVNNILLIHLSDSNSNAKEFKQTVEQTTGKPCTIAEDGLEINMNLNTF